MLPFRGRLRLAAYILCVLCLSFDLHSQSSGNSGSLQVTVTDQSGAVIPDATVELQNPVSGYKDSKVTDQNGFAVFHNVPFNPYHTTITSKGFNGTSQDVEVRSSIPVNLPVTLAIATSNTTVNVQSEAADLIETTPTFHTDVDRILFEKFALESATSSVSSLVTGTTPGISADSNGLFHGMGDHAENSFSVDGQPITDQQSKVFSNQIPLDSVASMEVIPGAPPAEYGDKTSVVINVTTRSGQGVTTPHGSVTGSYGSFGSSNGSFELAYGGAKWGNFVSLSGLNTGRFLDAPEFQVFHDKGNEENAFDRIDYQLSKADQLHLNLGFTRSWFENPNSIDQQLHLGFVDPLTGSPLGPTDQRSQIKTFNIAPTWTRLLSSTTLFTFGGFVRQDQYHYYPSPEPFSDFSADLQNESIGQSRKLTNAGLHSDVSYVKGIHNLKLGATYQHTFLTENDSLGIVDQGFVPSQSDANGNPCFVGGVAVTAPCTTLLPIDLTRGGNPFGFHGHTDIKELALYLEDAITKGPWSINLGIRGDLYNGLATHQEAEPRLGIAYNFKKTNTVLRVSYARVLETPFNENLVLSSTGCNVAVIAALVPCVPAVFQPGFRNEFHAGLEQAFGKYLVFSGEYVWKYTHNGYDFSVLGNTPITFPIEWHNSKIPGVAGRVSVPNFHGFTALMVFSSVAARFFPPQIGGLGTTVGHSGAPFRIDHDEKFNQTTHLQYQPSPKLPWVGFNWRYDSGQVAGAVPFAADTTTPVDLTGLTADQQLQAGLFCGNVFPTLNSPLSTCVPSRFGSTRASVPAPGTENDDHNPVRIASRNLFDANVGDDNIFHGDKYKWSLQFTAINLTNKVALYNFLSTFSGTHFVTPRSYTAQLGFHF